MNAAILVSSIRTRRFQMYIQKVSDEAVEAIELGRKNHWWFRVLGDGGMIDAPVYQNGWWFEPLISSECTIPSTAMRRVDILKSAGIKIQGCIIAHEAPLLLTAPKIEPVAIPWGEILTFTVKGLAIVT